MTRSKSTPSGGLRLSGCDIRQCEGRCCYDGVYLQDGEETFLRELVSKVPALKALVPDDFVVDGYWQGEFKGRKTATRPAEFQSADFPAHFTRTRCVFGDKQGFCELEKFARERGQHPWTFKPTTCWMFPLQDVDGKPAAPVRNAVNDPNYSAEYPGYASCLPCGRHEPGGRPWRESLRKEIGYLKRAAVLPVLGSVRNSVDELLAQGQLPGKKNPA
jgi:hypothetical protein